MQSIVNIKSKNFRMCAFCTHWYEPTNYSISPQNPAAGFWVLREKTSRNMCQKKNVKTTATFSCLNYQCKI